MKLRSLDSMWAWTGRAIYSALLLALTPLLLLYLLFRSRKDRAYRQRFAERFAFKLPGASAISGIVLHTVSVGEFNAAKTLIKKLLLQYPHLPLTITCTTPTASAAIVKLVAEQRELGYRVEHCYLPFDYPLLMRRWLAFMQPQLLLILETELWPNLLANCKALAIPTLIINARLSARSAKGYRRFGALTKPMLQHISQILTQDKNSARRFAVLGARQVQVAGNLKYELDVSNASIELAATLKPLVKNRIVWVAGSTHAGEDEMLLQAYTVLRKRYPQLLLVLVPRHPERFDAVAQLLQQQQLKFVRRSDNGLPDDATEVWLADSMGELLSWYQLADLVFIGGSLIPRGGHNPLEAICFGKAVQSGPHIFNFNEAYRQLQQQQAVSLVANSTELLTNSRQLLADGALRQAQGQRAQAFFLQQQGATARTLQVIQTITGTQMQPVQQPVIKRLGSATHWYDPSIFSDINAQYFQSDWWQQQQAVLGSSTGRNTAWFVQHQQHQLVLRHYYRGGMVGKLLHDQFWLATVANSRAMREYQLLSWMRQQGLAVPRPVAARYQRYGLIYRADLLIERIAHSRDLAALLQQRELTALEWQAVGAEIARMHQLGVDHTDLNCRNILLDQAGKVWLIDFDKCRRRPPGDWQQQNLQRLLRSLHKEQSKLSSFHWQEATWQNVVKGYQQHKMLLNPRK